MFCPEEQAQRLVEAPPRGELVSVPGMEHAPTLVEPVTIAALERFLHNRNAFYTTDRSAKKSHRSRVTGSDSVFDNFL
jgi:hypothetical protein